MTRRAIAYTGHHVRRPDPLDLGRARHVFVEAQPELHVGFFAHARDCCKVVGHCPAPSVCIELHVPSSTDDFQPVVYITFVIEVAGHVDPQYVHVEVPQLPQHA